MSTSDDDVPGADEPRGRRFGRPRIPRLGGLPRRSPLATTVAVLLVVIVVAMLWSRVWTEKLWFDSVGYSLVWRNQLIVKSLMFLAGGLVTALLVGLSLRLAYRQRPVYAPVTVEQDNLDRYREAIDPFRRVAFWRCPRCSGCSPGWRRRRSGSCR